MTVHPAGAKYSRMVSPGAVKSPDKAAAPSERAWLSDRTARSMFPTMCADASTESSIAAGLRAVPRN